MGEIVTAGEKYENVYRRLQVLAGIDRTTILLEEINLLPLSEYAKRLELLIEIGYAGTNYDVWARRLTFTQCEWTFLMLGLEPMKEDVRWPNVDALVGLMKTVDVWLVLHQLVEERLDGIAPQRKSSIKKGVAYRLPVLTNHTYRISDFARAMNELSLPIPVALGYVDEQGPNNDALCLDAVTPSWVLQPIGGKKWRVGLEDQAQLLDETEGLVDLRYAVLHKGEFRTPLEYYASSDDEKEIAGASQNFKSDDAMDHLATRQVVEAFEELESDLQIAEEQNDIEKYEEIEEKLNKYKDYMKDLKPGGSSRKLTEGSVTNNATNAMRNRKRTVLKNLRKAGLEEMADHVDQYYEIKTHSFSYSASNLKV